MKDFSQSTQDFNNSEVKISFLTNNNKNYVVKIFFFIDKMLQKKSMKPKVHDIYTRIIWIFVLINVHLITATDDRINHYSNILLNCWLAWPLLFIHALAAILFKN